MVNTKNSEDVEILYLEENRVQNTIFLLQEDLIKGRIHGFRNIDLKKKEILKRMADYHNVQEKQIIYYNGRQLELDGMTYYYFGYCIDNLPEGFGKLLIHPSFLMEYEGTFHKG